MERAEERIYSFIDDVQRLGRGAPGPSPLSAGEFITVCFLASAVEQLLQQQWLQAQTADGFSAYLDSAFTNELRALSFLSPLFHQSSKADLKTINAAVKNLTKEVLGQIPRYDRAGYQHFVRSAVARMSELTLLKADESQSVAPVGLAEVFYRAFDAMDSVFGLDFARDRGMSQVAGTNERLYEGAGLGVQTSYSTILTALYHLRLPEGAHLIDLGSGYGRLGLIAGLWREDLRFTGYEFVGHRVEVAEAAAEHAGLSPRVRFLAQDLGDRNFEIPVADAYYMYDPFCAETYARVLRRIDEIGESKAVAIVTKGNAGNWFTRTLVGEKWLAPERYDDGTLLIFRNLRRSL